MSKRSAAFRKVQAKWRAKGPSKQHQIERAARLRRMKKYAERRRLGTWSPLGFRFYGNSTEDRFRFHGNPTEEHLGVTVSESLKNALKQMAQEKGVSVSRLVSDILSRLLGTK